MVKSLDSNQIKKIDRAYIQPIYFIHIPWTFSYGGYDPAAPDGNGNSTAARHASTTTIILNQNTIDNWLDIGVRAGFDFKFDNDAEATEIASVDSNDQLTLVSGIAAEEGWTYRITHDMTLYFSDRNFSYNGHNYEAYIQDFSDIENKIRNLGGYDNTIITLQFRNDRFRDKSYLLEFFDDYRIEKQYIEFYKLLVDTGETFGSDVSTLIARAEMGQPYEITELGFKVDCVSMLFGKNAKLPLDVIDLADFPMADPDDVGKHRNILYGSCKKVVCPWTVAGWLSTLTADITAAATSIEVSDATGDPATPFTSICDNEEIRVTGEAGNTLTVTRGYNATTARTHGKGTQFYQKLSTFEVDVAMHPVKLIGDVFVKREGSEWLRLVSGYTAYESSGGRAKIVFSDKPKFGTEGTLDVALTDEPHDHGLNEAEIYVKKTCTPTGSSGPTGHANVIDGNQDSYCALAVDVAVEATFTEASLGALQRQYLWIHKLDTAVTGYVQCPSGTNIQTLGAPAGWYRVVKTGGNWGDSVAIVGGASGNQISEIYKEIEYIPTATTVTTTELNPYLTGNSVANIVIGDVVACDVDGYEDDGSGTYTGTPDALIERPDHVRKHILIALLKFASALIDGSFATIGAIYAARIAGGYKFAFNLPEVATETGDLFRKMDEQTRSVMFESQGKFKLAFSPTSTPTSQITFGNTTNPEYYKTKTDFLFGKTEVADIRNKLRAYYFRDYTKSGTLGEKYQKVEETINYDSKARYGEMAEDLEFDCIGNLEDMVEDVIEWVIHEKALIKRTVEFAAFWNAMILEGCDYFTVISNLWSGYKFRTLDFIESNDRKTIKIRGLEYMA